MTVRWDFVLAALLVVALAGCGSGRTIGGSVAVVPPSNSVFAKQIQPIFDRNCAITGCHSSDTASGGMVLEAGKSYANLVNVTSSEVAPRKRVLPGNSGASYIIEKLTQTAPSFGDRMPLGGDPLPSDQIDLIKKWINDGAKQ